MLEHPVLRHGGEARMTPDQRVLVNAWVILWMVLPLGSAWARSASARRVRPLPRTAAVEAPADHCSPAFLPSARASGEPYSHTTVSTPSSRPVTHCCALNRLGSVGLKSSVF